MARSELTRSQRQYAHVQNALAQRLARELKCAKGVPFPDFIEPMQPTLVPIPPSGDMWLHEIKYDGYRVQVQVQQNGVHFLTRRGHDWTDRFKALAVAASGLKTYAAVLDGEVIVPGPNGTSDFGALQEDLGAKRSDRMVFCAFDVLYLDGLDLRSCPLEDRKRVLAALLKGVNAPIAYSEHLKGIGKDIVRRACGLELEGIVSKRRDARYQSGRRTEWLKMTCRQRERSRWWGMRSRTAGSMASTWGAGRTADSFTQARWSRASRTRSRSLSWLEQSRC
jgi:bifunctional non-homologous end joining protein LigD